jgi:hypothetical protein
LPKPQVQVPKFPLHISYFLQNYKKGKSPKKDLPLLKNDITDFLPVPELKIHSRNLQFSPKNWDG